MENVIAKRLKAARKHAGLTQQQLSDRLGFKDRQTLAAIESGLRKLSADELLNAMKVLNRDVEYFTDPFRIDGEANISWRVSAEKVRSVSEFEEPAGRWPALYRYLAAQDGKRTAPLSLNLTTKSSYEDAHSAADWLANEWKLGGTPAVSLEEAVRTRLQVLVLYVDAPDGISGAAFRLPELSAILINRNELVGRRNFNLAHELFHLLTWETLPPAHSEETGLFDRKKKRGEQLANCFASALLMPENTLRGWWERAPQENGVGWSSWVCESAVRFCVSATALQWRLVQLGMLKKDAVDESHDRNWTHETMETKPRLFSSKFVEVLRAGLDEGRISVRRASALVGLSVDDLAGLFREYSLEVPFDI